MISKLARIAALAVAAASLSACLIVSVERPEHGHKPAAAVAGQST